MLLRLRTRHSLVIVVAVVIVLCVVLAQSNRFGGTPSTSTSIRCVRIQFEFRHFFLLASSDSSTRTACKLADFCFSLLLQHYSSQLLLRSDGWILPIATSSYCSLVLLLVLLLPVDLLYNQTVYADLPLHSPDAVLGSLRRVSCRSGSSSSSLEPSGTEHNGTRARIMVNRVWCWWQDGGRECAIDFVYKSLAGRINQFSNPCKLQSFNFCPCTRFLCVALWMMSIGFCCSCCCCSRRVAT